MRDLVNVEVMAEVFQMEVREAIAKYHECRKAVDWLEGELEHALNELEIAKDVLDMMNVKEYE
jgi:hypothetical protein